MFGKFIEKDDECVKSSERGCMLWRPGAVIESHYIYKPPCEKSGFFGERERREKLVFFACDEKDPQVTKKRWG